MNHILNDNSMEHYREEYYKMKKDAVTLFGLQMYKYALRREKEDIENGIMDVFLEDVMKPLNLTVTDAARMLGVSRKALSEFVNEKASLSPEMAIRISKATNTSPESWMNMQQKLTLWTAQQNEPSNVIPFPLDAVKEG